MGTCALWIRKALALGGLLAAWQGTSIAEAACGSTPLPPGDYTRSLQFGALARSYDLHVPASATGCRARPLLLDFHGFTSTKEAQAAISGFRPLADAEGFVIVHPQGYQNSWNAGDVCCGAAQALGLDDVGLAIAIAREVATLTNIDSSRIYATGLSNGGAMTQRLACEAAHFFAAAAPVAYPIDRLPPDACQPARPIALRHYHGFQDAVVLYAGSAWSLPVVDSFAHWGVVDACSGAPQRTFDDGNGSYCETYTACGGAVEASLCSLVGPHVLYTNSALDIARDGWRFLARFQLPLPDRDLDQVPDVDDNCPGVANPLQEDADCDCTGDACETALLRNDEVRALDRRSPPLDSIFTGSGGVTLDALGPWLTPVAGEGPTPSQNGSPDLDDLYLLGIASPVLDPDPLTLLDARRPLVFYQLDAAGRALRAAKRGPGVELSW